LVKTKDVERRLVELIAATAGVPTVYLTRSGVFSMPKGRSVSSHSPWHFVLGWGEMPSIPMPIDAEPNGLDELRHSISERQGEFEFEGRVDGALTVRWDRDCAELVRSGKTGWEDLLSVFDESVVNIEEVWREYGRETRRRRLGIEFKPAPKADERTPSLPETGG